MNWQNCTNARQLEIERRQRRIRNVIVATIIGVVLLKFFCGCASHPPRASVEPVRSSVTLAQRDVSDATDRLAAGETHSRETGEHLSRADYKSVRALEFFDK